MNAVRTRRFRDDVDVCVVVGRDTPCLGVDCDDLCGLRHGEDAEKHQRHHADEGDPAPHAVREPAVELVGHGERVRAVARVMRGGADRADPVVAGIDGRADRIDADDPQAIYDGPTTGI